MSLTHCSRTSGALVLVEAKLGVHLKGQEEGGRHRGGCIHTRKLSDAASPEQTHREAAGYRARECDGAKVRRGMGLGTSERIGPFIKKPPESVHDALGELDARQFLLVGRPGPTCFVIQEGTRGESSSPHGAIDGTAMHHRINEDDDELPHVQENNNNNNNNINNTICPVISKPRKFKVFIGNRQSCSCGGGLRASSTSTSAAAAAASGKSSSVCVHLLFVLHRVLGVPRTNSIVWQLSLTERELDEALRCELHRIEHRRPSIASTSGGASRCGKHVNGNSVPAGEVAPRNLAESGPCPICYEDVAQCASASLVHCRFGCGNWIHGRCMQQWVRHQSESQRELSCPMCRHPWGDFDWTPPKGMRASAAVIARHREKGIHYGVTCSSCKLAPISGPRLRCRICSSYNLCRNCYDRGEHAHHPFVSREEQHGDEIPAERDPAAASLCDQEVAGRRGSSVHGGTSSTSRSAARNISARGAARAASPPPAMPNAPPRATSRTKAAVNGAKASLSASGKRRTGGGGSHVPDVSGLVAVGTSLTSS